MTPVIINPCTAELVVNIFYSFEAGIANAISNFNEKKNNVILSNFVIWPLILNMLKTVYIRA